MGKRVRVHVTKEDIENGVRESRSYCPIALAMKRTFGTSSAMVCGRFIYTRTECNGNIVAQVPKVTRTCVRFIKQFDAGKPVEPFTFNMETTE